jgi:hypothetical protein
MLLEELEEIKKEPQRFLSNPLLALTKYPLGAPMKVKKMRHRT